MLAPTEILPITVKETNFSAYDVITISMHNLIAYVSSYRPWWSEFLALGSIDCPTSFSSATSRALLNLNHFSVNYILLTAALVTLFLIGDLTAFLTVVSFAIMWLLLYFYRDQPLVLYGLHISDGVIVFVLFIGSLWALWFCQCFTRLVLGVLTSVLLCFLHAVLRNPDDIFVQEEKVVLPSTFLHWS